MSNIEKNLNSFAIVGNLSQAAGNRFSQPPGILSELSTEELISSYEEQRHIETKEPRKQFMVRDYCDNSSQDELSVSVENSEDFEQVSNKVSLRVQILAANQELLQMNKQLIQFTDFIESHKRNIKRLYQNQIILKDTINGVYSISD